MTIESRLAILESEISAIRAELAKPEPVSGAWRPKAGEGYWTLNMLGAVRYEWFNDLIDRFRISHGLVFRTEAEAKARLARGKVEAQLRDLAGGYSFTYGKVNCYLSKYEDGIWEVEGRMNVWVPGVVYFATKEAALAARDAIGKDKLDLLLGA